MLYDGFVALILLSVAAMGLFLVAGAIRVALGSRAAYDLNRSISKGVRCSMFGDVRQPSDDNSVLFNCGIAYTIKKDNSIIYHPHAMINKESIQDTSI